MQNTYTNGRLLLGVTLALIPQQQTSIGSALQLEFIWLQFVVRWGATRYA